MGEIIPESWATSSGISTLKQFLAQEYAISADYQWHSIRRIIEATALKDDLRARSRWTRALEFAWNEEVEPDELVWYLQQNGGLSGCARKAARGLPRYYSEEEDENDDEPEDGDEEEDCEINPPRWEKEEWRKFRRP
ncbi:hypothetical protein [Bradyrhizobium icense]|uniref:Uncharacterized protein n=1 Tax=Bradyrhizobium icense TaxID=1274631 RepID=A0A1B1UBE4_9BRAD|nr:hypothetical protein [Bradyrhizobium icense]ANW00079.1 hypothetical protein LMTR13_07670 [Bradyrhizobium icense]